MKTNKAILIFNLVAFILTWAIAFWIYYLINNDSISVHNQQIYHSLGSLGPTLGAFCAAYLCYGNDGVRKLVRKIFSFGIPSFRTLIIAASPLILFVVGLLCHRIVKHSWFDFQSFISEHWDSVYSIIVWVLPLIAYAIFEEIGWRGFLLPHLQEKYNAWISTIYLTIIWALWHIPFFFYRFEFSIFISIGFFFGLFVGAIIMTSLYNSCKGGLWAVILFHLLMNICSGFDKEIIVAVLSVGYVYIAINLYLKYDSENLSFTQRTKNYFISDSN